MEPSTAECEALPIPAKINSDTASIVDKTGRSHGKNGTPSSLLVKKNNLALEEEMPFFLSVLLSSFSLSLLLFDGDDDDIILQTLLNFCGNCRGKFGRASSIVTEKLGTGNRALG
mmetsp:Transcript_61145/g.70302  ORF Transcript_61145/g.70302 Transcript_61145/m.70302 type:complete len:115 (+) Transcript_61145:358-702(+)